MVISLIDDGADVSIGGPGRGRPQRGGTAFWPELGTTLGRAAVTTCATAARRLSRISAMRARISCRPLPPRNNRKISVVIVLDKIAKFRQANI
jgi:hypothetical protein